MLTHGCVAMTKIPTCGTLASPDGADAEFLPLSARQTLLWLDDQLYPEARYHNLVQSIDVEGALDVPRLTKCFAEMVAAHDTLRMSVDAREAKQFCLDSPLLPLPVLTIEPAQLESFILERSTRRLNQGTWLWDAALLRLGPNRHVFYFCQDHIVTDGVSIALLVRELEDRYLGRPVAPSCSFRDYLRTEATYRESAKASADKTYWDEKVAKGSPPLRPYGRVRSDTSVALDRVWWQAHPALVGRLLAQASSELFASKTSAFSRLLVMATALSALIYRITGNREVLIGLPISNRRHPFKQTMGLLMEQLFLRIQIEEGDTLARLAERVREEVHDAIARSPVCVSDRGMEYVTLNMMPRQPSRFAGMPAKLQFSPTPTLGDVRSGHGDLRDTLGLQVMDFAHGSLEFAFDFHKATFDARNRGQMGSHLMRVLECIADNLHAPIDTLVLTDGDEIAFLRGAETGQVPSAPAPDVLERLAENARRRPRHTAVVAPDWTLDYAALDAITNRLARRLRSLGVGRESRVGVAVPRGAAELATLLATLKAGGAYVPVDPAHPVERVRVILEDASPQVLVAPSNSLLVAALPPGAVFLPLDDLSEATRGFDDEPLAETHLPNQLAYILFTSGSTGRPKGVEVSRAALANFLRSMAHTPGLSESERLLAITTTTFDIAGLELFLPLYVGATVVIADRDSATDPRRLRDLIASETATVMQATPATWRLLLDAGYKGNGRLRMLVGGEALSLELAQNLLKHGAELWNLYGPTETTVWSSVERVEHGVSRITIGRPIDRTKLYVLDASLQRVPPGVIGEICIGGDGLARGYRGRPDLTAERFVPDPLGGPGDRLYRTGDLGRILPSGQFECLGRADNQVKIRGFRIELGEIESVLRAVPGVHEVVVTLDAITREPRLVAYWVGEATRQALFETARTKLPQYMIPSAYQWLERFPLTTSGKIDRKALPAVEVMQSVSAPADVCLPRNQNEARVARIFSEVLGISMVGVDQDFFELGGTSVLVIQARERFEKEFGVELPLRVFFKIPTVAALAGELSRSAPEPQANTCLVQLKRGQGKRALFLIHDADGEVLLYRNLAMRMPPDVAVYGVVPLERGRLPMAHATIEEMAEYYVREIRAHQPQGPYFLGGLCAGGVIASEAARLLADAGQHVALLALIESVSPRAPMRTMRVAKQRLHRTADLLKDARALGMQGVVAEGKRRLLNMVKYEASNARRKLTARLFTFLHARRTASNEQWPDWLPAPSARDIYLHAAARYAPRPVAGVHAVLVRAADPIGPEPSSLSLCAVPDFGWSSVFADGLETVDCPGSHSTLLQESTVDRVAQSLLPAFARADC
jgi:amino acid adenylation domain-containing protein